MGASEVQLNRLSDERFEKWLKHYKINLLPQQKALCQAIFKLAELTYALPPHPDGFYTHKYSSFAALGSGLTFAFKVAHDFIKSMGDFPHD